MKVIVIRISHNSRQELFKAILQKDTAFISAHIATNAYISSNESKPVSRQHFMHYYFPAYANPASSSLWPLLQEIFQVGGGKFKMKFTAQGNIIDYFYAPYTSVDLVKNGKDLTAQGHYCVITGEHVRVWEKPDTTSRPIGYLSYDMIRYVPEHIADAPASWVVIPWSNGKQGYVKKENTRTLNGARAAFKKEGQQWKLEYAGHE